MLQFLVQIISQVEEISLYIEPVLHIYLHVVSPECYSLSSVTHTLVVEAQP